MTTDVIRDALRPLLLTTAWFAFLALAAFAWAAAVENPGTQAKSSTETPAPEPAAQAMVVRR